MRAAAAEALRDPGYAAGVRSLLELVGRVDILETDEAIKLYEADTSPQRTGNRGR